MRQHAYTHILHSVCAVVMVLALALMIAPAPVKEEDAPVSAAVPQTLEGRVIAVDAGHGGYDGGARAGRHCGRGTRRMRRWRALSGRPLGKGV